MTFLPGSFIAVSAGISICLCDTDFGRLSYIQTGDMACVFCARYYQEVAEAKELGQFIPYGVI